MWSFEFTTKVLGAAGLPTNREYVTYFMAKVERSIAEREKNTPRIDITNQTGGHHVEQN